MTQPESADAAHARPRTRLVVAAGLAVLLLLAVGLAIGRLTTPAAPPSPSTTSAEAGFARDMQTHHLQAVEMAMIIRSTTEDPDLLTLSYDIATSQAQQAGQMFGWLSVWGLPAAPPEPAMTWMSRPALDGAMAGHGDTTAHVSGEPMPGLATSEQLAELREARGGAADELFLTLMIAHHRGGVGMAEALLERSDNAVTTGLARAVVSSQQGEISYMRPLLAAPSPPPPPRVTLIIQDWRQRGLHSERGRPSGGCQHSGV